MPMQTSQKRVITHPLTDGNVALVSQSLPHLSLMKNAICEPQIEASSQAKLIMTVMAMTIGLCMLWFLVVFTLYQIARFAL